MTPCLKLTDLLNVRSLAWTEEAGSVWYRLAKEANRSGQTILPALDRGM